MDSSKSKLVQCTVLDPKDELDERLEKCLLILNGLTQGLSEREANDSLQSHVCKGNQQHEEVQLGFFYSILIDPKNASKSFRDMLLVCRDGLTVVITKTNQIIHEKWSKLQDGPRTQVLWLAKELVKNSTRGCDSVCHSLIRQIAGGDVSPRNVWLTEAVLDVFTENKGFLEKYPLLLATAVYTFLRVILDHGGTALQVLRQREVEFCISYLRERFTDCMAIGRDLVRLMQFVARIPEFHKLWLDMLYNPTTLCSTFTGIQQLMQMRTSRYYFASRLTPDMENKLAFLTTKVRFGQQKRYQDWFQRQYLSTPESQSLRCDLIRYICAVIHPSNEVLCSDIIPRWAVIGWLLTTCTSNVAASNAKLSLFYDWMFFDPEKESIMNIEPCILVMYHSMRPHPAITATLLDFMCRIMNHFYPPLTGQIKQGFYTALNTILEKRVLPSLSPLFDNPKLDRELRAMIKESFPDFCSTEVKEEMADMPEMMDSMPEMENNIIVAEFSDEEDEIPLGKLKVADMKFLPIKEPPLFEEVDISDSIEQLDGEIKNCVIDMQSERENERRCNVMYRLVHAVIQEELDQEMASHLATCVCQLMVAHFFSSLFPQHSDEESIEDSISTPLFVVFRTLCETPEENPARQPILLLLEEMYNKQPRIGYHFLYFLKVSKVIDEKMAAYKDFCSSMESRDLATCLKTDLKLCAEDDVRLFTFLIPDVYTQFPSIAIGNTDLMHLIVSNIDGTQLQDLVCQILQGHLVMFRKDSFLSVLNASLDWETIEQYFLWQLISSHSIPIEHIMPILPKLEYNTHAEALTSILILLKQDGPTQDLIKPILCRECKKQDMFTVSILKYWVQEYEDKLADLLHHFITRATGTPNRKRKGSQVKETPASKVKDKDNPTVEQVMAHLEHMRQTCRNISFLTNESIQQALQHVSSTCSEALKNKHSELLALAEDFDDMRSTRVLRAVPSRRASAAGGQLHSKVSITPVNNKKKIQEDSESSEESSDDEEAIKPKAKKRKKVALDDDSD